MLPQGLLVVGVYAANEASALAVLQSSKVRSMLSMGARPKGAPTVVAFPPAGPASPPTDTQAPQPQPSSTQPQAQANATTADDGLNSQLVIRLWEAPPGASATASGTGLRVAVEGPDIEGGESMAWLSSSGHVLLRYVLRPAA